MLTRQLAARLHLDTLLRERIDYDRYTDFAWVSVERHDRIDALKFNDQEGWSWYELSEIKSASGGAAQDEVDAFRLMAMFLNHWDNKPSNQRLVCAWPAAAVAAGKPCEHVVAMIQDAGATFGPAKVNLRAWTESPIWADIETCTVSMKNMPYDGGTFRDVRISEEGRRLLASRLLALTRPQVTALFAGAQFHDVERWVAAFERRVDAIARRPPCPTTT
jgi:hypothetical protein